MNSMLTWEGVNWPCGDLVCREEAASVRMLANLLFHSPCALCITDATQEDMPIVYVNHVFEKATGYMASQVRAT